MDRKEFAREQKWLDRVYKEIDEQLAEQEAQVREFYAEMREIRRSLSEEHRISSAGDKRLMDAAQRIVELRHGAVEFGIQHSLLRQLRALERNPYFGRIDFQLPVLRLLGVGVRFWTGPRAGRWFTIGGRPFPACSTITV